MESERDAWGLSSADWCHVAINFKRSARIVQTSFPVLLFLKKKKKKKNERAISPCPPPSLHPLFPIYLLSNLLFSLFPGSREENGEKMVNFLESLWIICDIEEKATSGFIYLFIFFFRKEEIRMWVSYRIAIYNFILFYNISPLQTTFIKI